MSPKTGNRLTISVYYDRHGHNYFTVTDYTQDVTRTVRRSIGPVIANMPCNAAGLFVAIDNGVVSRSATDRRLWQFTSSHMTTYTGVHGTIPGPWATSNLIDITTGTATGRVVMSPSSLWSSGQNFGIWLRHR